MKKLMIAALAVAFAAVAQAASFNWQNTGSRTTGTIYNYTGAVIGENVVAYLFDVATISQEQLLSAVRGGADIATLSWVDSQKSNSSSKIVASNTPFEHGEIGKDYTFFFAILDKANEQILISDTAMAQGLQGDTATASFTGSTTWSKNSLGEASYTSAGWYSTVPEPTSALLLLLGMGGLALKRKQA